MLARSCEPALQDLLDEAVEPQLTLPFGEARAEDVALKQFISDKDFGTLPKAHQKLVQQAVSLFGYLRGKEGQSLAPVFTPLLGPLDEVSKAVMLKFIGPKIPDQKQAQEKFFAPDFMALPKKEAENYLRRGKDLKRTLVDHNGMSPIGLLRWCLQHARESATPVGGVFAEVKASLSNLSDDDYKLVSRINTFRNDYIAHQNKELTDAVIAAEALGEWVAGLCRIWRFYG